MYFEKKTFLLEQFITSCIFNVISNPTLFIIATKKCLSGRMLYI